jgi:leucyl-tRNA synthetase
MSDTLRRFLEHRAQHPFFPMALDGFAPAVAEVAVTEGRLPCAVVEEGRTDIARLEGLLGIDSRGDYVVTSDRAYYRLTQWIFLELFARGLVFRGRHSWRVDISGYAERLLNDLDKTTWGQRLVDEQRAAIGRQRGVEVIFHVSRPFETEYEELAIFTSCVEMIYGVTFLLLDPWHPVLEALIDPAYADDLESYRERLKTGSEPRISACRTGGFALNPVNLERIPVLASPMARRPYSEGVVLGVPGHDRDLFALAQRMKLPIREVIHGTGAKFDGRSRLAEPWLGDGILTNSATFSSSPRKVGRDRIIAFLSRRGIARRVTRFLTGSLKASAAAAWGPPVPLLHCERCGVLPVAESDLPLEVAEPPEAMRESAGAAPRAAAARCTRCGGGASRDAETILPWLGSAWSFLYPLLPQLAGPLVGFRDSPGDGAGRADAGAGRADADPRAEGERDTAATFLEPADAAPFEAATGAAEAGEAEPAGEAAEAAEVGGREEEEPGSAAPASLGSDLPLGERLEAGGGPALSAVAASLVEEGTRDEAPLDHRDGAEDDGEDGEGGDDDDDDDEGEAAGARFPTAGLRPFDVAALRELLPVDSAIGASRLSVHDILAVRFLHRFLHDLGAVPTEEPFARFRRVGSVTCGPLVDGATGGEGAPQWAELITRVGADTVRLLFLFSGAMNRDVRLDKAALRGVQRLLDRIWSQCNLRLEKGKFVSRRMLVRKHVLIHEVTRRLSRWEFHNAVAALMHFVRFLGHPETTPEEMDRQAMETFLVVLSPFAPHLAEELWSRMGHEKPLRSAPWPVASAELVYPPEREFVITVNGKVRDRMQQPANLEPEKLKSRALQRERVRELVGSKDVTKVVVVPQTLVSIVTAE